MNDKPGNGSTGLRGVVRQLSLRRGRNVSHELSSSPKQSASSKAAPRDRLGPPPTTGAVVGAPSNGPRGDGALVRSYSTSSIATEDDPLAFQPHLRVRPTARSSSKPGRDRRVESVWGPPPASSSQQENGHLSNMFGVDLESEDVPPQRAPLKLRDPKPRLNGMGDPFAERQETASADTSYFTPRLEVGTNRRRSASSSGHPTIPSSRERNFWGGLFGGHPSSSTSQAVTKTVNGTSASNGETLRRSFDSVQTSAPESPEEPILPNGAVNVRRSSTLRTDRDMGRYRSRAEQLKQQRQQQQQQQRPQRVSSTKRGKPSLDLSRSPPISLPANSPFHGYWAPPKLNLDDGTDAEEEGIAGLNLSSPMSRPQQANDAELGSSETGEWSLTQNVSDHMRAKRELMGHGPFYAVQRGWRKGVFSSHAEADRQIRDFPGPLMKIFDNFDEATAFVKATKPVVLPSTPDEDESTGGRFIGSMARKTSVNRGPAAARGNDGIPRTFSPPSGLKTAPKPASPHPLNAARSPKNPFWISDAQLRTPSPSALPASTRSNPFSNAMAAAMKPLNLTPSRAMTLMTVSDLQSSVSFYRDILGFAKLDDLSTSRETVLALPSSTPSICIALRVWRHSAAASLTSSSRSTASSSEELPSRSRPSEERTALAASCILLQCAQDMKVLRKDISSRLAEPSLAGRWPRASLQESTSDEEITLSDPDGNIIICSRLSISSSASSTSGHEPLF